MKGAKTVDAISWVKEHSPALLPLVIIVCFSTGLAHRAGFHLPFNFTFVNTENFHSSAIEASFDVFFILLALGLGWGTSYFLKTWLESKDHLAIFFCLVMGVMTIATIARASVNFGTHLSLVSLALYVSLLFFGDDAVYRDTRRF